MLRGRYDDFFISDISNKNKKKVKNESIIIFDSHIIGYINGNHKF